MEYRANEIGEEIGPLVKIPTIAETAYFAKLSRLDGRFTDINTDTTKLNENKEEFMIVSSWQSMGYLTQLITNWMLPQGFLTNLNIRFRRVIRPNDTLKCLGIITDIQIGHDKEIAILDLFIENQIGDKPLQGTAEVSFPNMPKN